MEKTKAQAYSPFPASTSLARYFLLTFFVVDPLRARALRLPSQGEPGRSPFFEWLLLRLPLEEQGRLRAGESVRAEELPDGRRKWCRRGV